jgi:DnaK suppressor protein
VDQEILQHFKALLQGRKHDLLTQANQTVNRQVSRVREHFTDYGDIATQESAHAFQLRIRDRERQLIKKIDQALERIEDDTFGLCERCGEEIAAKRLEARPMTTFCINCKTALEEQEID